MKWFTPVDIPLSPFKISHSDKIISIGSCFSENVGRYFQRYKFQILLNPFGQLYNPVSIYNALKRALDAKPYTASDLILKNGLWHSFDHHSKYSAESPEYTLQNINNELYEFSSIMRDADIVFITFGTAFYFHHLLSSYDVANCHKIPANEFERRFIEVREIVYFYKKIIAEIREVNPKVKFVFTVSPVRYLAYGSSENTISKGTLHLAIYSILKEVEDCYYFPSYEIVMDELRDYRFFTEDLIHPNEVAIKHVWDKVSETFFTDSTKTLSTKIDQIIQAASHRPFNPNSESHKKFIAATLQKMDEIELDYKFIHFRDERKQFNSG